MLFQRLSTSNTFLQWVTEKQKLVAFVNDLTDGYNTIYANTNISVGEDLHVNGNVLVTGTFILDEIDFDDLSVAGNLTVDKAITAANGEFLNLNILNNVSAFNVTTNALVGQNAFVYGSLTTDILNAKNLNAQGSLDFSSANVTVENIAVTQNIQAVNTTTLKVGTEGTIYGKLAVEKELSTVNLKSEFATYNNIQVVNDVNVVNQAVLSGVVSTQNLTAGNNLTTLNLETNAVDVQNLQVNQNVSLLNVTNNLFVGTDATIYGNLNVIGESTLANVLNININTANITTLIGSAETQIYNTINASTAAVTVAANIATFTGFILALG